MKRVRFCSLALAVLLLGMAVLSSCKKEDPLTDPYVTSRPYESGDARAENALSVPDAAAAIDLSLFSDADGAAVAAPTGYEYTFSAVSGIPDGDTVSEAPAFLTPDGHIVLQTEHKDESGRKVSNRLSFDRDGTLLSAVVLPDAETDVGEDIYAVAVYPDGSYLFTTYLKASRGAPADAKGDLLRVSPTGELLAKTEIPGTGGGTDIDLLSDGRSIVTASDSICVYDTDLTLLCEIPIAANEVLVSPKGEVLAQTGWAGQYSRINMETYTSEAESVYAPPDLSADNVLYFSVGESAYDAYFADDGGFYGMNAGDTDAVPLCRWEDSGQNFSDLTVLAVFDESTLFVSRRSRFSDTETAGVLKKTSSDVLSKKQVTVGIVDNTQYFAMDTVLTDAVSRFNAQNGTYTVSIKRYAKSSDDKGKIPDAFKEDMLAGTAPDIIVSSYHAREGMADYADKNAFADLGQAVSAVLAPCAVTAYERDGGALYAIPLNMYFPVLVTKDAMFSGETLSLGAMGALSEMADMGGVALFSTVRADDILSVAAPSFIEWESGTCDYDGEAFADFIRFYERVPDTRSEDGYSLQYEIDYTVASPEIVGQIRDDTFLVLDADLNSMTGYAILKLFYDRFEFTIHGYPAHETEIYALQSDFDISLNADSIVQRGAMEFIAYLLSDEIQTYSYFAQNTFPVTVSAIEMLLEKDTYTFTPDIFEAAAEDRYQMPVLDYLFSEEEIALVFPDGYPVTLTQADKDALRKIFYHAEMQSLVDTTLSSIIEEELSAYRAGAQTLERTQEILQSRVFIYINE